MIDLTPKPCPFCGQEGVIIREGSTFRWLMVECSSCGAAGPEIRVQTLGPGSADEWRLAGERDAIEEWNRRRP